MFATPEYDIEIDPGRDEEDGDVDDNFVERFRRL